MPVVLFNIGWMKYYRGQTRSDRIFNGGQYVRDKKTGDEVENFLPLDERYYAYVRIPHDGAVNMARLGVNANAKYVDDVTVVFVATPPAGGSVVVGWYRHARVWCQLQERMNRRYQYIAEAQVENCTLLEVDERTFSVPRAGPDVEWGIGQSNIRYTDENNANLFVHDLLQHMEDPFAANGVPPHQTDPARRTMVERAAVDHVIAHYHRYNCVSVESENKGWDLEFTRGAVKLLVEVKGVSGDYCQAELTRVKISN